MKEIEFNLLTEPWIRVRLRDNTVREVSLTEALVSAQDYVDLAGEMPTQNAAVLRLLLAVLFTYGIAYGMFLLYPVSLIPCIVVVLSCMAALTVAACYQPLWDLVLSQWPDEPDSGDDGTTP